jgi:hypothetical protein
MLLKPKDYRSRVAWRERELGVELVAKETAKQTLIIKEICRNNTSQLSLAFISGFLLPRSSYHLRAGFLLMRFFLAGIMQGSHLGELVHNQDYRTELKGLLQAAFAEADVYDPWADHQDSLGYDSATGREVFLKHNQMCTEVDVVIAFVPSASMGTAIEIWEAHRHGRLVISISPLIHNWAIKFCSDRIYADLESFVDHLHEGKIKALIDEKIGRNKAT